MRGQTNGFWVKNLPLYLANVPPGFKTANENGWTRRRSHSSKLPPSVGVGRYSSSSLPFAGGFGFGLADTELGARQDLFLASWAWVPRSSLIYGRQRVLIKKVLFISHMNLCFLIAISYLVDQHSLPETCLNRNSNRTKSLSSSTLHFFS